MHWCNIVCGENTHLNNKKKAELNFICFISFQFFLRTRLVHGYSEYSTTACRVFLFSFNKINSIEWIFFIRIAVTNHNSVQYSQTKKHNDRIKILNFLNQKKRQTFNLNLENQILILLPTQVSTLETNHHIHRRTHTWNDGLDEK